MQQPEPGAFPRRCFYLENKTISFDASQTDDVDELMVAERQDYEKVAIVMPKRMST